jgi:hypothetical protein
MAPNPHHCNIAPMFAWLGDKLEITFDGNPPDAADVVLKVTDVVATQDELVTEIKGEFKGGAFVAKAAGSTNKKAVSGEDTTLEIEAGGKTHSTMVLTRQQPARACQINVEVLVGGSSKYKANPPAVFVARKAPPAKRSRIAFLVRSPEEPYFDAAKKYWETLNFTVVEKASFKEIVDTLVDGVNKVKGPWGEVNIVTHGNEVQVNCPIETGTDDWITGKNIDDAKGKIAGWKKLGSLLDSDSYVVIRGCNIGNNDDLLKALREIVFQDKCTVYAPLHYQFYEYWTDSGKLPLAYETFKERLAFYHDGTKTSGIDAAHKSEFQAKHATLNWTKEEPTFEKKKYTYKAFLTLTGPESALYTVDTVSGVEYKSKGDKIADWDPDAQTIYDGLPEEYMKRKRGDWNFGTRTTTATKKVVDTEMALESAGQATPVYILVEKDTIVIGATAKASEAGWRVKGAADQNATVEFPAKKGPLKITALDPNSVTLKGGKTLAPGKSTTVNAGDQFTVGTATITVRGTKEQLVEFKSVETYCEVRRRTLRKDSTQDFKDRMTIVPDWTGSDFKSA